MARTFAQLSVTESVQHLTLAAHNSSKRLNLSEFILYRAIPILRNHLHVGALSCTLLLVQ